MALDAICYLQQRCINDRKWMNNEEILIIEKINGITNDRIDDNYLSMSTLSLIISTYTDNINLEKCTIDDLINIFKNVDDVDIVVRNRITNEFVASYVFPMLDFLKDGWAENYITKFQTLKSINFEKVWREEIYPKVIEQIERKKKSIKNFDTEKLFKNISLMKGKNEISDIKIYISFFSYPTAFTLYNNCFLDTFGDNIDLPFMIAHELMHGFASNELIELYIKCINEYEYLKNCHQMLVEHYHSGNEEEFVIAAEYYICYKLGIISKEKIFELAKQRYNKCIPLSLIIFEELSNEKSVPRYYNKWLVDKFSGDVFFIDNIKKYINLL